MGVRLKFRCEGGGGGSSPTPKKTLEKSSKNAPHHECPQGGG